MTHPLLKLLAFVLCTSLLSLAGLAYGAERDCTTATHCALMELAPWHEDADEPNRAERILDIADAIDAATVDPVERAFLAMTAYEESRLAKFVHLDEPKCREGRGGWCDDGKSFSPWQLKKMSRTETVSESAVVALTRYRQVLNACGNIAGAISMYATGKTCEWSEAPKREKKLWKMHWRMGK